MMIMQKGIALFLVLLVGGGSVEIVWDVAIVLVVVLKDKNDGNLNAVDDDWKGGCR